MTALTKLAKDRRLNIIEDLKAYSPTQRRCVDAILADARGARRFILGDEASLRVGEWTRECEDILLDNLQFAKPPFPSTYVEISIREIHKGIGRPVTGPVETADDRVGYLITGNHVRCVVLGGPVRPHAVEPGVWEYWMNTPEDQPSLMPDDYPSDRNEWMRLTLLLGSTVQALKDEDQRLALCYGVRIRCNLAEWLDNGPTKFRRDDMATMARSAAGEMRTLWAVLLLINQHRHKLSFYDMPRQVALTPKRKVYMAHTLITLPLHPTQDVRRTYYPNTRASPIAHEVRGHWVRYHLQPGCEHHWPTIPDEHGHFVCERCRGWRTWKKPFHRGNAAAGFDVHTYEITP